MARRWRIRHKLMLGLATAIAILALLVAGTLNGLWSYYVTIKAIESKLGELDEAEKRLAETIPLGRLCEPDDIAGAAVYLASDDAAFVTGVVLPVDGGRLVG